MRNGEQDASPAMFKVLTAFLVFACTAAAAAAAPVITSVSPNTSTVNGGIHVTIKGSGFTFCPICSPPVPPAVGFGLTPATSVRLIDTETLDVVAPMHLPGTVDVFVYQFDGTASAPNAFTFTGSVSDAFETILLPIYSRPVHGAFGSEFHTIARVVNKFDQPVEIDGIDSSCLLIDPPHYPSQPFTLTARQELQLPSDCSQWPGHFLFVPNAMASSVTVNDRVFDVSRSALSNGTEIPVVRSSRFATGRIVLVGVPIGGPFRNTLRVYAMAPMTVDVFVGDQQRRLVLQPGPSMFEPAYGSLSVDSGTVTIEGFTGPVWAFITVTNNDTQQITTISPD